MDLDVALDVRTVVTLESAVRELRNHGCEARVLKAGILAIGVPAIQHGQEIADDKFFPFVRGTKSVRTAPILRWLGY